MLTLEEGEEAAAGTVEGTATTSQAPVLLTTGGGGGALRRLPGSTEVPATTRATIRATGDVSETASVPGLSSAAICTLDTSAPSLSSGGRGENTLCVGYTLDNVVRKCCLKTYKYEV